MKTRKLLLFVLIIALAFTVHIPSSMAEATPPIAQGVTKKPVYVYWGKSEAYPIIGLLGANEEIDIYEYDKTWVLTKYESWVTYNGTTVANGFYGYLKRKDVTCDPPLEGDQSDKADTGPGKRKKRPPKRNNPGVSVSPAPTTAGTPVPASPNPTATVEDLMEYDWLIRTPGVCSQTIDVGDNMKYKAQFSLMAFKFGGYSASSLPVFNDGNHNDYCGYCSFNLEQKTQDVLNDHNLSFLQGLGGVSIDAFTNNGRFFIDSQTDNGTRAIFTLNMMATSTINPQINDEYMGISVGGEMFNSTQMQPLDMRLEPSAGGYQLVLLNMKPGGGDLKFPAMLEKFPLSDIDKAERERLKKEGEERMRQQSKELLDKILEDWRNRLKTKFDDESNLPKEDGEVATEEDPPVVPSDPSDNDTAPGKDQAPVPNGSADSEDVPPEEGATSGGSHTLAPLTGGGTSENVDFFPGDN